ncbi:hypothetical protein F4692_000750 [Nocardioides cavernae]|uniref:Uncharacterized protein n=1 Tax=Nocardioides cavernae TaxID=1921566 RepID=A0A7Y9H0C5_9ACTN|nr:hypothetical protein [Nocardioides cavernae]NYE35646.1 hypothetical protein [Nocardioides cavernae]
MAGGMTPGGRETLAERLAATRARDAERQHGTHGFHGKRPADWADVLRAEPRLADAAPAAPAIKHCWYDGPHGRQAALLLEWRGFDGYFRGRIAVAAPEADGWAIVEMWVEQGMLSPVE